MPICPVDTSRYGSSEIKAVFDEESRLRYLLKAEIALVKALEDHGLAPPGAGEAVEKAAQRVKLNRVKEIEKKIKHELMAVVEALYEVSGDYGKYLHFGATSNDIIDTATSMQLRDSLTIIERRLRRLALLLKRKAKKYRDLVMIGRTHGQHASPITLGFKFAVYACEVARNLERLRELKKRVLVCKLGGPVGTMAAYRDLGLSIEKKFAEYVELPPAEIYTQVLDRDRYAELVLWCALTASSLDRIATEIRNLQRTEIMEVAEGFKYGVQVGSSSMPHKTNPITCEKVSGLAKVLRGFTVPALENIPLWHERDLTNSSCERFIIPLSLIILDEMLLSITNVIENLKVFPENINKNLWLTDGRAFSEAIVAELFYRGVDRRKAYFHVKKLVEKSLVQKVSFREVLEKDDFIRKYLSKEDLVRLLKPENFLGEYNKLIERALNYVSKVCSAP
ncbi:MAG: adenylosuccinate lyase [Thermoprotei archaeon]|nr:MAG: adenylosuccinate lyase [Thermoprotei archaeon]RLF01169.1 MAG: adenylosuccinate lyase [Thermoprotei archaeon]